MIKHGAIAILLLLTCTLGCAEDKSSELQAATDSARANLEKTGEVTPTAIPDTPAGDVLLDTPTRDKYLQAMRAYFDYRSTGFQHRTRIYEWQLFSSRIIFVIVLLLVFVGIYFSAVQFHVALAAAKKLALDASIKSANVEKEPPKSNEVLSMATRLEISTKGLVVNSSVLGVVILVLSLAFFYLYLVYVYPITDHL